MFSSCLSVCVYMFTHARAEASSYRLAVYCNLFTCLTVADVYCAKLFTATNSLMHISIPSDAS